MMLKLFIIVAVLGVGWTHSSPELDFGKSFEDDTLPFHYELHYNIAPKPSDLAQSAKEQGFPEEEEGQYGLKQRKSEFFSSIHPPGGDEDGDDDGVDEKTGELKGTFNHTYVGKDGEKVDVYVWVDDGEGDDEDDEDPEDDYGFDQDNNDLLKFQNGTDEKWWRQHGGGMPDDDSLEDEEYPSIRRNKREYFDDLDVIGPLDKASEFYSVPSSGNVTLRNDDNPGKRLEEDEDVEEDEDARRRRVNRRRYGTRRRYVNRRRYTGNRRRYYARRRCVVHHYHHHYHNHHHYHCHYRYRQQNYNGRYRYCRRRGSYCCRRRGYYGEEDEVVEDNAPPPFEEDNAPHPFEEEERKRTIPERVQSFAPPKSHREGREGGTVPEDRKPSLPSETDPNLNLPENLNQKPEKRLEEDSEEDSEEDYQRNRRRYCRHVHNHVHHQRHYHHFRRCRRRGGYYGNDQEQRVVEEEQDQAGEEEAFEEEEQYKRVNPEQSKQSFERPQVQNPGGGGVGGGRRRQRPNAQPSRDAPGGGGDFQNNPRNPGKRRNPQGPEVPDPWYKSSMDEGYEFDDGSPRGKSYKPRDPFLFQEDDPESI